MDKRTQFGMDYLNLMKSMSEAKLREYGSTSSSRIIDFIGNRQASKERLLVQVSAIAGLNLSLSREAHDSVPEKVCRV